MITIGCQRLHMRLTEVVWIPFIFGDISFNRLLSLTKITRDYECRQSQVAFIAHRFLQLTSPFEISYPPFFRPRHQLHWIHATLESSLPIDSWSEGKL